MFSKRARLWVWRRDFFTSHSTAHCTMQQPASESYMIFEYYPRFVIHYSKNSLGPFGNTGGLVDEVATFKPDYRSLLTAIHNGWHKSSWIGKRFEIHHHHYHSCNPCNSLLFRINKVEPRISVRRTFTSELRVSRKSSGKVQRFYILAWYICTGIPGFRTCPQPFTSSVHFFSASNFASILVLPWSRIAFKQAMIQSDWSSCKMGYAQPCVIREKFKYMTYSASRTIAESGRQKYVLSLCSSWHLLLLFR